MNNNPYAAIMRTWAFAECPAGMVKDPVTGRCMKKAAATRKKAAAAAANNNKSVYQAFLNNMARPCPAGKIRNPATGRCVNATGAIGKKITKTRRARRHSRRA
jgi:hypothetical protein